MARLGVQLIPHLPVAELIATAQAAEELGYDYCLVADEGLMHDVYVVLGALAHSTSRITIGPVTNGYTRHPAVTAAAMATLQEASGGRAVLELVAGGTMVLGPMGLHRDAPVATLSETIRVCRRLWTGEQISWQGERFQLVDARLSTGVQDIPIWVAARGDKMLHLAGQHADGVVLMVAADVGAALAVAERGWAESARDGTLTKVYLDRLAYTPTMIEEAKALYSYALMDSPDRLLANLGLSGAQIERLRATLRDGGPAAVAPLVTATMLANFQIAGTPEHCRSVVSEMVATYDLDVFMMNVTTSGLEANVALLRDVRDIVTAR
jgi:5,10-methylenetetrahydromethanopterin reductase